MTEKEIKVGRMEHRELSAAQDPQMRLLTDILKIYRLDMKGERVGSYERRKLVRALPNDLWIMGIDDFLDNTYDPNVHRARELLLTDAIESTSIIQESVQRTVVAGAEKMKVIRNVGVAWYKMDSGNALRVPLGAGQYNADEVAEGASANKRTQDYSKRDFTIVKYMAEPNISFEMIEDGLIDTVAEELFYAGAAIENKLNYDALTALATNAGNTTKAGQVGSGTAGTGLSIMKYAKKMIKADGYFADTIIMNSDFEADLLANSVLNTPYYSGGPGAGYVMNGELPSRLLGMRWFVTDNGSSTVDGTYPWEYNSDDDVGAIVLEAKRGCGVAMRRDVTVKKFEDIRKELMAMTVSMRCDVNYLQSNAIAKCVYDAA